MPNITSYQAPNLDLDPAERGASAWSAAGRTINSFYGDVAGFQRQQGSLAAQAEKMKLWPFDMLRLYEVRAASEAEEAAKRNRGGSVRIVGGGRARDPFASSRHNLAVGGETPESIANRQIAASQGMRIDEFGDETYAGVGQVSRGARALGGLLSDGGYTAGSMAGSNSAGGELDAWGNPYSPYQQRERQLGRQKFREMNEALAYAQKISNRFPEGPQTELYQGDLVHSREMDKYEAKQRAAAQAEDRESFNEYSGNISDYWQQYYGYKPGNKGTTPQPWESNTGYVPTAPAPQGGGFIQDLQNWVDPERW